MRNFIFSILGMLLFSVSLCLCLESCKKSSSPNSVTPPAPKAHTTGWSGKDNPAAVPKAVNTTGFLGGAAPLPPKIDLTPFLPPIGNQGQTQTCVAWSTAYYTKTASEAIAFNYSAAQLSSKSFQLSPKDMFLSIADNSKGADCQSGTNITFALDVLLNNGVATEATVPWEPGINNCSQSQVQPAWNAEAADHKIEYYRTIPATVQGIKEQLANNNPVIIGIKISNEYEGWTGPGVLSTATFPNPVGLHAQTIVGYDDAQGPGGAFRIANSWSTGWGDNGFIWVDYNTLVNLYIADGNAYYMATSSSNNNVTPPAVPPNHSANSVDMAPWVFSDASTSAITGIPDSRKMYLNIYNIGNNSADAISNWGYYYLYYNAYDANDYGVIFHDEINTSIPPNTFSCATNNACVFNFSIPGGSNFATEAFGKDRYFRSYNVPPITGYYYLVLVVDAEDRLNDINRQNNIFYTTGQGPAVFQNGEARSYSPQAVVIHDGRTNSVEPNEKNLKLSKFNTSISKDNRNAYTPKEILSLVKARYENGEMKQKLNELYRVKKVKLNQDHKN
jgi:hypothetical protein